LKGVFAIAEVAFIFFKSQKLFWKNKNNKYKSKKQDSTGSLDIK